MTTSNGAEVYNNSSITSFEGTTNYTLATTQLSVNETMAATLGNRTAGTTLATDAATITVEAPRLTAAAAANATDVPVGATVEFTGSGSSLVTAYAWDLRRDGSSVATGSGQRFTHTFGSAGVYSGNLSATDGTSHLDDDVTVVVGDSAPPTADLEGYPSPAVVNETVSFSAGTSADDVRIKRYEWDFDGDGSVDTTTTPSSPGGGTFVSHTYSTNRTYTANLTVTDYVGNTDTASATMTVRPEPNVTASSVTWTGNGTQPSGSIVANTTTGGGMFLFHLHPQGSPQNMNLSAAGADGSTELWVNFTVENYAPDAVMGGANLHEWETTPNANGAGTNFSLRLQPVELQRNTSFTGVDPNQWQSTDDRANLGIPAGVYLGAFDMPDGTPFEANMTGATLTSDAQAFMPPRYDQQAGQLNYSVAAPHWKQALDGDGNTVQNVGFYEAVIPSGMVSWRGISNPEELAGTYRSGGSTTDLTNMAVGSRDDGDLYINVTGIHYSSGTVSLEKDGTAPTAAAADVSGTEDESVTFDASGSSDNREISSYEWDWDGDGTYETSTSSVTTDHTFSTDGSYAVTLRVTDGAGNTDTATATASIAASSSGGGDHSTATPTPTPTPTPTTATAATTPTATPTETAAPTPAETVTPTAAVTTSQSAATDDGDAPTGTGGQPGFGALAALGSLLAVTLLARRWA